MLPLFHITLHIYLHIQRPSDITPPHASMSLYTFHMNNSNTWTVFHYLCIIRFRSSGLKQSSIVLTTMIFLLISLVVFRYNMKRPSDITPPHASTSLYTFHMNSSNTWTLFHYLCTIRFRSSGLKQTSIVLTTMIFVVDFFSSFPIQHENLHI
jgi:hypothetical protein